MRYLVHCTSPIEHSPGQGNFRGEPRWERNALEACVLHRSTHTTNDIWPSLGVQSFRHPECSSGITPEWVDESVLISYGVTGNIYTGNMPELALKTPYKIIQYHDGPNSDTRDTFTKYSPNIIATTSSKAWLYKERLEVQLGSDNVYWVPGPCVQDVHHGSNFDKHVLTWTYRNFNYYADNDPVGMGNLFSQIASYMDSDQQLEVAIILQNDEDKKFLAYHDWFKPMLPFVDRVKTYYNMEWIEVMKLLSITKLVISPAEPLGMPPFEAGSYGIPVIVHNEMSPFHDKSHNHLFHGVIDAPKGINKSFLSKLDKLYINRDYYDSHGNAVKGFVEQYATYDAYIRTIEGIMKDRGWM